VSWSRQFDDPIEAGGKALRTLKEAADHVMKLPKAEQQKPHWQAAGEHLIYAAERESAWTLLAWMAMMQALNHGTPRPPRKRTAKTYRIVR